jgi:SAM-dependent methyltransferase
MNPDLDVQMNSNLDRNLDARTVAGFGDEWSRFDQSALDERELRWLFGQYFRVFPWEKLPEGAVGFDVGCGSGRWAKCVAPRDGEGLGARVHAVQQPDARRNLAGRTNCVFHHASVDSLPLADNSADFGYSLGVLHHVPDTAAGIRSCAAKLKPGAPLLLYLYYAFDNRPAWFRAVWKVSEIGRGVISRSPHAVRSILSQAIAAAVYWPLAKAARLVEKLGRDVENFPLAPYRKRSFYSMRTDALDRFGTRLEQRFTRREIEQMMRAAGLENVTFSDEMPYWCAVGYKAVQYGER